MCGQPERARGIPLGFQSYRWDDEKGDFDLDVNTEVLAQVKEWLDPGDTVLVMCRSGGRSAHATQQLREAGFENAWNVNGGSRAGSGRIDPARSKG